MSRKQKALTESEATEMCKKMGQRLRAEVVEAAAEEGFDLSEAELPVPTIIAMQRGEGIAHNKGEMIRFPRGEGIRHGR
jgi:hypothetical protein